MSCVPVISIHGILTRAKGGRHIATARTTGTEGNRRLNAPVRETLAKNSRRLATDRLRGHGPEGMSRHSNLFEIQSLVKRMSLFQVPFLQAIQHRRNILHAKHEVFARGSLLQRAHAFRQRLVFPDRIVASGCCRNTATYPRADQCLPRKAPPLQVPPKPWLKRITGTGFLARRQVDS